MITKLSGVRINISEHCKKDRIETIQLYPGIELSYITLETDNLAASHEESEHILEINYCRSGRIGWKMKNGNSVYLGQKDFSLHSMKTCADSVISLPNGSYEGLTICVDLNKITDNPPEILADSGINGEFLYKKFCQNNSVSSFAGNEQTESIFSAFYGQPDNIRLSYQKIKALEVLLYISKPEISDKSLLSQYRSEQIEIIRKIHEQLTEHMEQRFTITDLSKQYLMNPTTLKTVFKAVYGTSIAAHIKEHRMEKASELLLETNMNITEIAGRVGYDSPSKFTAAFKEYSGKLPRDYRNMPV